MDSFTISLTGFFNIVRILATDEHGLLASLQWEENRDNNYFFLLYGVTVHRKGLSVNKKNSRCPYFPPISSILRYSLLIIGVMIALEISGIELSTIKIFAGALGVGIGFGLQNIANNLVSGFILLFERSIKGGDLITMADNTWGIVEKIGIRGTIIRTPDNQEIIVPNSQFISSSITNWTFSDKFVRLRIPVGVSYKSDPHLVRKILIDVAHTHPKMLTDRGRSPEVLFSEFGESSLNFILLVWVKEPQLEIFRLRSELLFSIFDALKENGIEIPFPQRDIHIRSGLPWERIPGFEEK